MNKCIVIQQVSDDEIKSKSPCVNLQANISSLGYPISESTF